MENVGAGNDKQQQAVAADDYLDGQIVRLNETSGFGYVKANASTRQFFFKLSRIEGHAGRSMREMGVRVGSSVAFKIDSQGRVTSVRT